MTVMIQGDQVRAITFGIRVRSGSKALAQDSGTDLFEVTGGRVAVKGLVGVVTEDIANTASLVITLQHTPTGGSAGDLSAATAVTDDGAGTLYSLTAADASEALDKSVAAVNLPGAGIVLPAGTVRVLTSNHNPGDGEIDWDLVYAPLDDGAAVEAA